MNKIVNCFANKSVVHRPFGEAFVVKWIIELNIKSKNILTIIVCLIIVLNTKFCYIKYKWHLRACRPFVIKWRHQCKQWTKRVGSPFKAQKANPLSLRKWSWIILFLNFIDGRNITKRLIFVEYIPKEWKEAKKCKEGFFIQSVSNVIDQILDVNWQIYGRLLREWKIENSEFQEDSNITEKIR